MTVGGLNARDLTISSVAVVLGAASLALALAGSAAERVDRGTPVVATVRYAASALQVRAAATLGWQRLLRGDEVHDADAVFVPPGSEAQLVFSDGTVLELDERSLVVVEPPMKGVQRVTLKQGAISGVVNGGGLALQTAGGRANLPPHSEARVDASGAKVELVVRKGAAKVQTSGGEVEVGLGRSALGAKVEVLPEWSVQLTAPVANLRRLVHGLPPPVHLSWDGKVPPRARVELARDRLFAFVTAEPEATGGEVTVDRLSPGVTWWRVTDERGTPLSEARRFTFLDDVAPKVLMPRDGEVVLALPGTTVGFAWTPLPGITRYHLELSSSRAFEPLTLAQDVAGAQTRLPLELAEGGWFWRVRAADEDLGAADPSEPARFRLIHRAIPDAPELMKPEVEVSPE